jgi:hypothetical protein
VNEISCDKHGKQLAAFVCKHLVDSLRDQISRGIHFGEADEAWCDECEKELSDVGEWTSEMMDRAGVTVICVSCLDNAKHINALHT